MQVTVESLSNLQRRMTITVPSAQMDAEVEKQMKEYAKNATGNGFRKGHVPMRDVKRMYGDSAKQKALGEVIQATLYAAITQEKLNPVGTPEVLPTSIVPGQPLEYTATFEVMPEIGQVNFSAETLEKPLATVTPADVDKVLDRLREQHTTWQEVDRPAQAKDQVELDFRGMLDGKTFPGGEAHNYPVIIGSNTMIPGFEEQVIGISKGDEKTIKLTFPADYFAADLAGKEVEFALTAHKVSAPQVAAMDADLIRKFGVASGDLAELRTEISNNLTRESERITNVKLKTQVFDLLLAQNPLEIPAALVEQEAQRIHNEMHPHHKGAAHNHSAEEMVQFTDAAKRNVALGLLIGEMIKQHTIKPDATRTSEHLTKLASAYEKPEEVIKWYQDDKRRMQEIEMTIVEEMVLEKLLSNVKVVDKMLDYSELIK